MKMLYSACLKCGRTDEKCESSTGIEPIDGTTELQRDWETGRPWETGGELGPIY